MQDTTFGTYVSRLFVSKLFVSKLFISALKPYASKPFASKLSLFFVALLFSLPFMALFIPAAIQGIYAYCLVGLLVMLISLTMLNHATWKAAELPQITFVFLGLIGVLVVQYLLGMPQSKQHALTILIHLLAAFMLTVLGAKLRREFGWEEIVHCLAWFVVLAGIATSILVIMQFADLLPTLQLQPTHIAAYLAMAIVSCAFLLAKQKINAITTIGIMVLYLGVIALLDATLGWLLVIVIALAAILQQIIAIKQQAGSRAKRDLVRIVLAILPAYALLQFFIPQATAPVALVNAVAQVPSLAIDSFSGYQQVWQASLGMFLNAPWLGVGVGKVAWSSFLAIQAPVLSGAIGVFDNTHNLILQLAVEMGLGALLLVVVGIIAWLKGFKWREMSLETWWLMTILLLVLAQSMVETQLWHAYFLGVTAFLLGAGEEKTTPINIPAVATVISALTAILLLFALASSLIAHHQLESAIPLAQKSRLSNVEESALYENLDWVHRKSLLTPYAELVMAGSLKMNNADLDAKIWLNDAAVRLTPTQKFAYRHVLLLKLKGEHAAAVSFLKITLNAYPITVSQQLALLPFQHWQDYLDVLSEARPIKRLKT